jgi:hypothetical protein
MTVPYASDNDIIKQNSGHSQGSNRILLNIIQKFLTKLNKNFFQNIREVLCPQWKGDPNGYFLRKRIPLWGDETKPFFYDFSFSGDPSPPLPPTARNVVIMAIRGLEEDRVLL